MIAMMASATNNSTSVKPLCLGEEVGIQRFCFINLNSPNHSGEFELGETFFEYLRVNSSKRRVWSGVDTELYFKGSVSLQAVHRLLAYRGELSGEF